MTCGFNVGEGLLDSAILADQEGGARNAHHLLAVHVLLFENAVGPRDFLVDVAQQRERQPVLGFETRLRRRRVRRDAQHYRVLLLEMLDGVTKLVSFRGSAGRIGAGEEIEHHLLTFELGKLKRLAGVRLQPDLGGFIAFVEH